MTTLPTTRDHDRWLNQMQENFCIHYVNLDGKGKEAAILAGYSRATATSLAGNLLGMAKIRRRINQIRKRAEDATVAGLLERKQRLTHIIRGELVDFLDEKGEPVLKRDIPNHQAVREFQLTHGVTKQGAKFEKRTIKLGDVVAAIAELNKMTKVYEVGGGSVTNVAIRVEYEKPKEMVAGVPEVIEAESQELLEGPREDEETVEEEVR